MTTKTQKTIFFLLTTIILATSLLIAQESFANPNKNLDDPSKQDRTLIAYEKISQKIQEQDFADIPLVASFVDQRDGKLLVLIDVKGEETKAEYENRVKSLINDPEVDLKIYEGYFVRESCTARDADCDPLYGGIEIYSPDTSEYSSLTIGATNDNSVAGFVMSGHAAGAVDTIIKQGGTTDTVGQVITNPSLSNRASDSAFVDLTSTEDNTDQVYRTSSTKFTVVSTSTPAYQDHVMISGISSEVSDGYVIGTSLTVYDSIGTLTDQMAADYTSTFGDSGAPVMEYRSTAGDVDLHGIHVGKMCLIDETPCPNGWEVTVFSKWSNVESELDLSTIP
jgi:hypothetical protein